MKKKIFITGITSVIMKRLCEQINFSEYEVIGLSRSPNLHSIKHVKLIKADIQEINKYIQHIKSCDIIIHAAASTHSYDLSTYYTINLEVTRKIVTIAKNLNLKKFVYLSSNCADPSCGDYGNSKLLAEQFIISNLNNYTIFRISEVYGYKSKEGIEQLVSNAIKNHFTICPKEVPYKFSPIHISDVTQLLFDNIFLFSKKPEIIGLNGKEKYSYFDIVKLIKIKNNLTILHLNKRQMFFINKIIKLLPFKIGIYPDQVERLYGIKSYGNNEFKNNHNLKEYISNKIT